MYLKILITLNLFLLLLNPLQAQDSKKYREEKAKIFQFFQDSILTNSKFFNFPKGDTIRIRKVLSNRNLFLGVSLFSLNPEYENPTVHSVFTESELENIVLKMTKDTIAENLGFKFTNHIKVVNEDSGINISKLIFVKNYSYCFLSYGWFNSGKTSIDGSTLFLFKKNGKWTFVKKVGDIKSW